MLRKDNKFRCQYSGLDVDRRVFIPTNGETKLGCFADANCAIAYLLSRRPRGYAERAERLVKLYRKERNETLLPAVLPWSLDHPDRREPLPSITQTVEQYEAERTAKKRKRSVTFDESSSSPAPASAPPALPPVAPAHVPAPKVRVSITDEKEKNRVYYTDNWRQLVQEKLKLPMTYAMPVFVNSNGRQLTVYPELECDGRYLAAADVVVQVNFPGAMVAAHNSNQNADRLQH